MAEGFMFLFFEGEATTLC